MLCFWSSTAKNAGVPAAAAADFARNGTLDFRGNACNKRRTGRWPGCFPMLVIEVASTVIFFGIVSNLLTYMTSVLHQEVAKSARDLTNWQGTLFVSSLLGAFLSDSYWGRFRTMSYASIFFFLGLSCLTISSSVKSLRPPPCADECVQPSAAQNAFFYFSLYTIAFSAGSMTSCLMSFGADQFDNADDDERRQRFSFFNWLIWCVHIGGFVAVTALVYIEDHVGWGWGFGILIIFITVAMLVFFVQTPRYRYRLPEGSPLTKVAQVIVAAFKKRNLATLDAKLHEDEAIAKGKRSVPHTKQFQFLDKAAWKVDGETGPWSLCTTTRVEEVKMIIRMFPIWIATLWFITAPSQTATFFLRQGMAMNNNLGGFKVPPASMLLFNNLGVLLFIPLYDYFIVPAMRKITRNERGLSLLQRIGVGISIGVIALVIAALMESRRKNAFEELSIFWLVPQYLVLGLAEGMETTGLLEFFHEQAPDTMPSLGISFALANLGVGNFLSSVLITCVNKAVPTWLQNDVNQGHLDHFYWLLAALSAINLTLYIPLAYWYSYKAADDYVDDA